MTASSNTPWQAINSFVELTTVADETIAEAREAAKEFGLLTPDALTSEFLEFLASRAAGTAYANSYTPTGIVMSPACGVVGLHVLNGFATAHEASDATSRSGAALGHLTCIEPEIQHQQLAKQAYSQAGFRPNSFRFLPSAPLDVVSRLATNNYDIAVAECPIEDILATVKGTLPALRRGGILVVFDTLLDGLVADPSRTDRQTTQAREADQALREMEEIQVSRLPLGAGLTLITKL